MRNISNCLPISPREISTTNNGAPCRVGTALENTLPVQNRARRARSARRSIPTKHVHGKASTTSAVHPPSSAISVLEPNSSATPTSSVLPLSFSTSPLEPKSPTASKTSAHYPTSSLSVIRAPPPVTASGLSGLLTTLCAWRFRTFYADYLPSPSRYKDSPVTLLCPLRDALCTVDWACAHTTLEIQCIQHELWRARGMRYFTPLVMKDRSVYTAARDAGKVTGIPLRQIRKVVEAYAFWQQGRDRWFNVVSRANGLSHTLTPANLAANKEWEKLARLLLEDLEDLQDWCRWADVALAGVDREAVKTAITRCKEKYFTHLAYRENRRCSIGVGKLARCMGVAIGIDVAKMERPSSAWRKMEWPLSRVERDRMDGKDELLHEMRAASPGWIYGGVAS